MAQFILVAHCLKPDGIDVAERNSWEGQHGTGIVTYRCFCGIFGILDASQGDLPKHHT